MIQFLGGLPVSNVVFAAGQVDANRPQLNYEIVIVGRVRAMCPGARVAWPTAPANDVWGAGYYLPLEERIGFLDSSPGGFIGTGNAGHGISVHNY
jgi:hypothetical protein